MSIVSDIAAATKAITQLYSSEVEVMWKADPNAAEYQSRTITAAAHSRQRSDGFDEMGSRTILDAVTVTAQGCDFSTTELQAINQDARVVVDGTTYIVETATTTNAGGMVSIVGTRL